MLPIVATAKSALLETLKSQVKMVNAEIKAASSATSTSADILRSLSMTRDTLINQISQISPDDEFARDNNLLKNINSHQKQETKTQITRFKDMPNSLFRKHRGPDLLHLSASYYRIFTDIFPSSFKWTPSSLQLDNLNVSFHGDNHHPVHVSRGNIISPQLTIDKPSINLRAEKKCLYTFVCVDADVPLASEKKMISSPLWMVCNVPVGPDGTRLEDGHSIVSYTPMHPFKGIGFHRYAWMALYQPSVLDPSTVRYSIDTNNWDFKSWFESCQMSLKGLVFHRSAWSSETSQLLYSQGKVKISPRFAAANNIKCDELAKSEDERFILNKEPVFGIPVSRSWKSVTQRLYKYAYK